MPTAHTFDPAPRVRAVAAATCHGASTGAASSPTQATPGAGHPLASRGGGPFVAPDATGGPVCNTPRSCDDLTLPVSTTTAYGSTRTVEIDVSWSDQQPVGTEVTINDAACGAMVAGDDDRAVFAFIGRSTDERYRDASSFEGIWDRYVSTTYDGAWTWPTSDATPHEVQRGSICTCGHDRGLLVDGLDGMDVTSDRRGRVEVDHADSCAGGCVTADQEPPRRTIQVLARKS